MKRRQFIKQGIAALATLAVGEAILLTPEEAAAASRKISQPDMPPARQPVDYRNIQRVPSTCLNCSTVCGIVGLVQNGELLAIEGNLVPGGLRRAEVLHARAHLRAIEVAWVQVRAHALNGEIHHGVGVGVAQSPIDDAILLTAAINQCGAHQ